MSAPDALRAAPATLSLLALTTLVSVGAWFLFPEAVTLGALVPARFGGEALTGAVPALLTPFTAALLHSGWMHLLFNMIILLWVGRAVEAATGQPLLILLYVAGAATGALASCLLDPSSSVPRIGASGAVSAVIAVYAMIFSQQRVTSVAGLPPWVVRALWLGTAWVVIQILIGLATPTIDVGAHVGGFLAGLVLARPLLKFRFRR